MGVQSASAPRRPTARTALQIRLTIYLTLLLATLCWAAGLAVVIRGQRHLVLSLDTLNETASEVILLVFTLAVTLSSDALGYVHAASLRWALFREGRLEFNTNYRLLSSARRSRANGRSANFLSAASLVLCYASVSALVVRDTYKYEWSLTDALAANALALFFLGAGLGGQAAVAAMSLHRLDQRIPSWSPNPLWNARTCCLDGHGILVHRPGRCMRSVAQKEEPACASLPSTRQPRLWDMRATKSIVVFLWVLFVASLAWALVVVYIPTTLTDDNPFRFRWNGDPRDEFTYVIFGMSPIVNDPQTDITFPPGLQFFLAILFLCAVQGMQALGLHCVELLVNMSRDEGVWRRAYSQSGVSPSSSPLVAAISSWQTVLLTVLKAALHWVLGQSMVLHYNIDYESFDYTEFTVNMSGSRLLVFAILAFVTAIFTTAMALWPVRGPQPATWGHLQTLADLVDDWDAPDDRLWWGDKGEVNGVRHAGTSGRPDVVRDILPGALYAGNVEHD